jgi:hypothetical protein
METDNSTYPESRSPVESAQFVDSHEIPEKAVFIGKFTDEYSPTDASAVYEIDSEVYVKTPVEA